MNTFAGVKQRHMAEGRIWSARSGWVGALVGAGAGPISTPPWYFAPVPLAMGAMKLSRSQPGVFSLCTIAGETFGACCRFFICLQMKTPSAPAGLLPGEPFYQGIGRSPQCSEGLPSARGTREGSCVPPYYSGQSTAPCSNNYIS